MNRLLTTATAAALVGGVLLAATPAAAHPLHHRASHYDAVVLADDPVAYWPMTGAATGTEPDRSGHGHTGTYSGTVTATTLPDGGKATAFDGATGYLEVADDAALSPATTGRFTIEAWLRPDTLEFPHSQSSGYVHWMGKGETGQHEYVSRMYSRTNTENRPNRISGYSFNLDGGLGAGSYFQDAVTAGTWIHYVLVINAADTSADYPHGYTKIYRDGVLRDQDQLEINGVVITPERGSAPLRVGTRDFGSWFLGAVGKVAVYDHELTAGQIAAHTTAMTQPGRGCRTEVSS